MNALTKSWKPNPNNHDSTVNGLSLPFIRDLSLLSDLFNPKTIFHVLKCD